MMNFYKKKPVIGAGAKGLLGAVLFTGLLAGGISAQSPCTIENIQGGIASGTIQLFATPGNGMATLFDPAGSGDLGDPGCFLSEAYPYSIDSVGLVPFGASGFGVDGGTGTYQFILKIVDAEITDDCAAMATGEALFTSETITIEITGASNSYPVNVDVGIDVNNPFFVVLETVSWTGEATKAPSLVLWDGIANAACRQYVISAGGTTVTDFQAYFTAGATGWTNVTVYGTSPAQSGTSDYAVTGLATDGELYFGQTEILTVNVENMGTADVANGLINITIDGAIVASGSVTLAAGATTTVEIPWIPAVLGSVEITATAAINEDVDNSNDSFSITAEVVMPPSDCVIEMEDFESYTLDYVGPQSDMWTTWTGADGTSEDLMVTSDQAHSGSNSLEVTGAATDVILKLDNVVSGTHKINLWMYVPEGSSAYWNIQTDGEVPGTEWAAEIYFDADGSGNLDVTGSSFDFTYNQGEWFEVTAVIDISNGVANFYIANEFIHQWDYSIPAAGGTDVVGAIGALNFYAAGGTGATDLFYIDDISFCPMFQDDACSALQLVPGVQVQGDNTSAEGSDYALECWGESTPDAGADVWYMFVAPSYGTYMITTNLEELTNNDTQLGIYTSANGCDGDLAEIGCNEDVDGSNFLSETTITEINAGDTIYIQVDGYSTTVGTFNLLVQQIVADNDECVDAVDLNDLLGGGAGETMTSDITSNINGTMADTDPAEGADCFGGGGEFLDPIESSVWYTFTGDGNTYFIESNNCNGEATNYIESGDTQVAIYSGSCGTLTSVVCNEDGPQGGDEYPFGVELETVDGETYYMMVDGWNGLQGEYCISFTQSVGVEELTLSDLEIFPNPTTGDLTIESEAHNITSVVVRDVVGKEVISVASAGVKKAELDLQNLTSGVYFVTVAAEGKTFTQKVVKN